MAVEIPVDPMPTPEPVPATVEAPKAEKKSPWPSRIQKCKTLKKKLVPAWSTNIDYRRGKPTQSEDDEERIGQSVDWSATKAKQAQLFSQVPEVRLTPKGEAYAKAVPMFGKKLNETLTKARVGVAMDECLPDCINASGIGFALVSYEKRTVDKEMQVLTDPLDVQAFQLANPGKPLPINIVPEDTDSRITVMHVSPDDGLWPVEFAGSDFDDAPWGGYSGRLPWSIAQRTFGLADEDKQAVCGADKRGSEESLSGGDDDNKYAENDIVSFDEIFYRRHLEDPTEPSFEAIWRVVYVDGKTDPVLDEPWKGQARAADGSIIGSCNSPLRALTLTYISGEFIPPSDSAMGRPQVDELMRSRAQMIRQREHSIPIRWFDVNRIAPEVQDNLLAGEWQGMIPVNGPADRAIGEVARASFPREDFEFNNVIRTDLAECWQVSPNQSGAFAPRGVSASEAQIAQANFQTRIGYERARVVKFFVGIAEVVAGLLALYGKFSPEEEQVLGEWDRKALANYYVYNVRADSTVLLDASQELERLTNFLNITAKSGFVDPLPIIRKMAMLSGIDNVDEVVKVPNPPEPAPANVSLRLTGAEDLSNPLMLAFLLKSKQAPSIPDIEAAKALLAIASMKMNIPGMTKPGEPPPEPGMDLAPDDPSNPDAQPPDNGLPNVPNLSGENEDWNVMNRIDKRSARPTD